MYLIIIIAYKSVFFSSVLYYGGGRRRRGLKGGLGPSSAAPERLPKIRFVYICLPLTLIIVRLGYHSLLSIIHSEASTNYNAE